MSAYRLYYFDSEGRIAAAPELVEFQNDSAAINAARALLNGQAIEVWQGARLVIKLAPNPKVASNIKLAAYFESRAKKERRNQAERERFLGLVRKYRDGP